VSDARLIGSVADYYTAKVAEHGATPAGVDWNGEHGQRVRFDQLLAVVADEPFSINDYGCGYGALLEPLRERYPDFDYRGFDVSEAMVAQARERYGAEPRARFFSDPAALVPADYTVASGIFNVRLDAGEEQWRAYVLQTIDAMARVSRRGIAFNALTAHSDANRMRDYLHYADPAALLDHCLRTHSRDVALRHDYELYEFTLIVRLDGRPPARTKEAPGT
jgi:SAM-dependent methyltransferase